MKTVFSFKSSSLTLAAAALLSITTGALAQVVPSYEVTIVNITRGQQFTPILATSHLPSVSLFQLGRPASSGLVTLAEEGNVAPLTTTLRANADVLNVANGAGLTNAGSTTSIMVNGRAGASTRISVAAMLIPTNDTFFALNGVTPPSVVGESLSFVAPAYDAGSERNDELCASIPGPNFTECGGPGGGAAVAGGEGFVHISAGMSGVGSFRAAARDWRNPVARITIRRVN